MGELVHLWLPILLTAVFVFIASSLIHMVFKWHNSDYKSLSNEDAVQTALRASINGPGQYLLPHCTDMKDMKDEAMLKKYREGPVGFLVICPSGMPNMGKMLGLWFVMNLAVAAITALLALQSFGLQGNAHQAGHLIGMTTLLAYGGGSVALGIWMGKPWISVAKDLLDAVIYGTISAFTFMWLWP
jgi:hypothetical protein